MTLGNMRALGVAKMKLTIALILASLSTTVGYAETYNYLQGQWKDVCTSGG
jgi:hypothetical protein